VGIHIHWRVRTVSPVLSSAASAVIRAYGIIYCMLGMEMAPEDLQETSGISAAVWPFRLIKSLLEIEIPAMPFPEMD
jgi:hypothetical protein